MVTNATQSALDVWAAARHHAAQGALGHPRYEEIFGEPGRPRFNLPSQCSSDETYDGTKGKYEMEAPPVVDHRILASIETVERALRACKAPEWFRRYLLFKHPRYGRFAPNRALVKEADPEDDARAFVESGHMLWMLGGLRSIYLLRTLVRTVRATERAFLRVLARELANRSLARQEPDARGGSRTRP
jgi:hypothetical protein